MKNGMLLFAFVLLLGAAKAQSYSAPIPYNHVERQGLVLQLPYGESVSEDFIVDNLRKTGFDPETKGKLFWKKNKINDFYVFKGVTLNGAPAPVDLYFKVDRTGKKAKDQSTISMLVSQGDENFVGPGGDVSFVAAQNFLNNFVPQSASYKLNLDIDNQNKAVSDAEKRLQKLQDDEHDISQRIEQLQKELRNNQNDQEAQRRQIETERAKLADLRNKSSNTTTVPGTYK
jgi:Holliday junction resolvase RusA-like endonuclease